MRIGFITIGQSPRVDVVPEMVPLLPPGCEIVEIGALDGLSDREIEQLAPQEGEYLLITRLADGRSVTVKRGAILARLQGCVDQLVARGVDLVALLCTGDLPSLVSPVPLVLPQPLLYHTVAGLAAAGAKIGVVIPLADQVEQMRRQWAELGMSPVMAPANPYGDGGEWETAGRSLAAMGADLLVMDCLGYTQKAKQVVRGASGKPVILARSLLARVICEITGNDLQ